MIRRIVIEMDSENTDIFNDILKIVADRIDNNVECSIQQEIISSDIKVPEFMNSYRAMGSLYKKGVIQNG